MITITVTGNLGADATLVTIKDKQLISFSMCTSEIDSQKKQWVSCAKFINNESNLKLLDFLKKGTKILVCGHPTSQAWLDKNTELLKSKIKITVERLELLSSQTEQLPSEENVGNYIEVENENIPF